MKKLALYSALLSGCVLLFGQGLQGAGVAAPAAGSYTPSAADAAKIAMLEKDANSTIEDFLNYMLTADYRNRNQYAANHYGIPSTASRQSDTDGNRYTPEHFHIPFYIRVDLPDEIISFDGGDNDNGHNPRTVNITQTMAENGESEKVAMLNKLQLLSDIDNQVAAILSEVNQASIKDDSNRKEWLRKLIAISKTLTGLVNRVHTNGDARNSNAFGKHNFRLGAGPNGTLLFKSQAARSEKYAQYYLDLFYGTQFWLDNLVATLRRVQTKYSESLALQIDPAEKLKRERRAAELRMKADEDAQALANLQGVDAVAAGAHTRTLEDIRARDEEKAKRAKEAQELTALQGKDARSLQALQAKAAKQQQAADAAAALKKANIQAVTDRQAAKAQADAAVQAAKGVADINAKNQQKALNKAMIGIPAGAIGVILAYYAFKNFYTPKPTIIEDGDTSMLTWTERLMGKKLPPSRFHELILSPEMWDIVKDKFEGIEKVVDLNKSKGGKHHGKLSNMMFWGPAGTGKTMAAENYCRFLAGKGKIDFIVIRGGVFKALGSAGAAQEALKAIFRFADKNYKATGRPTIFVFDEADSMLCKRNDPSLRTEITVEIVNTFLSMFPRAVDEAKMFIVCTNYPDRIDHAVLSRIPTSNRVEFGAPGRAEVRKMLEQYMDSALTKEGFGISPDVRNNYDQIADRMLKAGFVGRDIDAFAGQLVFPMVNQHLQEVTMPVLNKVLDQSTKQQNLSVY